MKHLLALLCILLLLPAAGSTYAAENYFEGWDVPGDPAGWTANTTEASLAVVNAGGNPGGFILCTRDPGGVFPIGAMTGLSQASGDWAAAGVFQISFDVQFLTGQFTDAQFRVRYLDSTFNGWHFNFTGDFTPGIWRSFVITVDPTWTDAEAIAAGWVQEATSPDFATTLSAVYHPEVRISGVFEPLEVAIDNFRLRACGQRTITLSADFNGDAPGFPPDLTLPGAPDCDALALNEPSGTVTVVPAVGSLTDQPILVDQVPGIGAVDVWAYPCVSECNLVKVAWNSLARSNDIFFMACVLRDAGGLILGGVEYRPNGELTYNSVGGVGPTVPVPYVPDVDQRFEILVDLAAHTTSLSIDGTAMPGFQNVPFAQAAAGAFFRLGFEGGGTFAQQFAFDNLSAYSCDCACDIDTTPPEIHVELSRDVLWPPNHKMAEVCATVEVVDDCDAAPTWVLADAWSDEPDNGQGDGNTVDDIQGADLGTADDCLLLRSERQGGGDGRTYSLVFCATDAAGNTACDTVFVNVPHDQSGNASPVSGFVSAGTGLLPDATGIILAVRSNRRTDASRIDPSRAWIGNDLGVVAPTATSLRDIDADGYADLLLTYPAAAVRSLLFAMGEADLTIIPEGGEPAAIAPEAEATAPAGDDALAIGNLKALIPATIGFRYEIAGRGYVVPDIFALGEVIPTDDDGPAPRLPDPPVDSGSLTIGMGGRIELSLPAAGRASVQVFDIRGRRVRTLVDADLPAGLYGYAWDGRGDDGQRLGSGIYFVRGEGPGFRAVRKVSIIR